VKKIKLVLWQKFFKYDSILLAKMKYQDVEIVTISLQCMPIQLCYS